MVGNDPIDRLVALKMHRLGSDDEAGLLLTSLPWPKQAAKALSLNGAEGACFPIGRWPGAEHPRRLLLFSDAPNGAPATLTPQPKPESTPSVSPKASAVLFERCPDQEYMWERHFLQLEFGSRSVGLALGLKTKGEVHWWEACRMIVKESTPDCLVVEMGGSIPRELMTGDDLVRHVGYSNPHLHRHNWLAGRIHARIFSNGVCEIYAHHINNKFVDDGLDLEDVVPVIGFRLNDPVESGAELLGPWDGSKAEWDFSQVRFDLREVARLATASQPGEVSREGDFLVLQPYAGVEVYGGICPLDLTGDPFIVHAERKLFPRGMARTLRFSLSLSDRSPKIARYLAPAWWYGLCEEFVARPMLPVSDPYDLYVDKARSWVRAHMVRGGFEDGSVPRHPNYPRDEKGRVRQEPGWEGELPYGMLMTAWRTGDAEDYYDALRVAYYFTDTVVDHATKLVRMHGYPLYAFSQPMNRVQGTIAAYLETGDPYLFEAAQAVITSAHWQHRNSWPRMAVGRDACYLRSAVLLYRYFGDDFYRAIAREGASSIVESQNPEGSFGDQGGGSGIHQWSGFVTKPWMGLLATGGLLDYLDLFPGDAALKECVLRLARWLMEIRWERDGGTGWSYQQGYKGESVYYVPQTGVKVELPTHSLWHHDSLGRLLAYASFETGDPAYLEAWMESRRIAPHEDSDHASAATLLSVPWIQATLWNATFSKDGVVLKPFPLESMDAECAILLSPTGRVRIDSLLQVGDHDTTPPEEPIGAEVANA